jgi:hypothetical protein
MPRNRDRFKLPLPEDALETNIKGVYTFEPPPKGPSTNNLHSRI